MNLYGMTGAHPPGALRAMQRGGMPERRASAFLAAGAPQGVLQLPGKRAPAQGPTYTIQAGDSITRIAYRFRSTPQALAAMNPEKKIVYRGTWPDFATLTVGETIRVPGKRPSRPRHLRGYLGASGDCDPGYEIGPDGESCVFINSGQPCGNGGVYDSNGQCQNENDPPPTADKNVAAIVGSQAFINAKQAKGSGLTPSEWCATWSSAERAAIIALASAIDLVPGASWLFENHEYIMAAVAACSGTEYLDTKHMTDATASAAYIKVATNEGLGPVDLCQKLTNAERTQLKWVDSVFSTVGYGNVVTTYGISQSRVNLVAQTAALCDPQKETTEKKDGETCPNDTDPQGLGREFVYVAAKKKCVFWNTGSRCEDLSSNIQGFYNDAGECIYDAELTKGYKLECPEGSTAVWNDKIKPPRWECKEKGGGTVKPIPPKDPPKVECGPNQTLVNGKCVATTTPDKPPEKKTSSKWGWGLAALAAVVGVGAAWKLTKK